jgi:hypothetical protein
MSDPILRDEILITLDEKGPVTVDRPGDFIEAANLNKAWSKTQVKCALGRLITDRKVRRHRRELQNCSDFGGPITFLYVHH